MFRFRVQCSGCSGFYDVRGAAPGYRDFGRAGYEGVVRSVGNNGYSWSSSVSGTNAFNLNFNSTNLGPSNAHNRGHGFQVRCLQAFTGLSAPFFIRSVFI